MSVVIAGGWTIFRLLPMLESVSEPTTKWFVFLSEGSEVNLDPLKRIFSRYESDYGIFLTNNLPDTLYPNFAGGVILSKALVHDLFLELSGGKFHNVGRCFFTKYIFLISNIRLDSDCDHL